MRTTCASVLAIALAVVSPAQAANPSKPDRPLLWYNIFPGLLSNPRVRAELKITERQTPDIDRAQTKWHSGFVREVPHGKTIDFDAINRENFDGMMKMLAMTLDAGQMKRLQQLILQQAGMTLFDYPEIRGVLNLSEAQAATLKNVHSQLLREISGGGKGRYSKEQVHQLFDDYMHGIPDRVRAALSPSQQAVLQELLGNQFSFK